MKILALSGLTECGKLAAATHMRQFGVVPFKIGDLLETVKAREGGSGDFQDWNFRQELERPDWLFLQFYRELADRVGRTGARCCSIDSLYGPVLADRLRRFAGRDGHDLVVVYIDADYEVRLARQMLDSRFSDVESAKRVLDEKDSYKISKGALQVRAMADELIENNGTLDSFRRKLEAMLARLGCGERPADSP